MLRRREMALEFDRDSFDKEFGAANSAMLVIQSPPVLFK